MSIRERLESFLRPRPRAPLLVIGGQKCGSTTLADDLAHCDALHVDVQQKEISPLLWGLPNAVWQWSYLRRLAKAAPDVVPVDVSSFYSMRQRDAVDIDRLARIPGPYNVVYLVRDRLARSLSHHHHDTILGLVESDFDTAATLDSDYVLNSCYGWQIQHWLQHVDVQHVLVVKFEDYITDRINTAARICDFVGVSASGSERINPDVAKNVSSTRSALPRPIRQVVAHPLYRRSVRTMIPQQYRHRMKSAMSVAAPPQPAPPGPETVQLLRERFLQDQLLFESLVPDAPRWEAPSSS